MIKNSLFFLAGTVVSTVIVVLAGGRPAAFVGLGFLFAVSIAAGVLWLTGVRRLAWFLNAFADGLASSGVGAAREAGSVRHSSGYRKPTKKQQLQDMADSVQEYRDRQSELRADRQVNPLTAAVLSDSDLFAESGRVQ